MNKLIGYGIGTLLCLYMDKRKEKDD